MEKKRPGERNLVELELNVKNLVLALKLFDYILPQQINRIYLPLQLFIVVVSSIICTAYSSTRAVAAIEDNEVT